MRVHALHNTLAFLAAFFISTLTPFSPSAPCLPPCLTSTTQQLPLSSSTPSSPPQYSSLSPRDITNLAGLLSYKCALPALLNIISTNNLPQTLNARGLFTSLPPSPQSNNNNTYSGNTYNTKNSIVTTFLETVTSLTTLPPSTYLPMFTNGNLHNRDTTFTPPKRCVHKLATVLYSPRIRFTPDYRGVQEAKRHRYRKSVAVETTRLDDG